jgi:hypothetical protein
MEAVFLIILLAVLVGVVWWRLNAKKSPAARGDAGQADVARSDGGTRTDGALSGGSAAASAEAAGTTGIPTAAGFGRPAEPAAPVTADEPAETSASVDAPRPERTGSGSSAASPAGTAGAGAATADAGAGAATAGAGAATADAGAGAATAGPGDDRRRQDQAEWETQWSEASGAPSARTNPTPPMQSVTEKTGTHPEAAPVHHAEYTEPHAPTLPGAESAAVEEADDDGAAASAVGRSADRPEAAGLSGGTIPAGAAAAEMQDRTQSSALVETGADHLPEQEAAPRSHSPEAAGHLAADEPYGAGSAAARADGSGPADYGVKADAGAMVYYEEGHPDYEQARADVWFESAAHAEAAGFRAPRRRRL